MKFLHAFATALILSLNRRPGLPKPGRLSARGFAMAAFLSLLLPTAAVTAASIGSGFSAMWYDPARSGEGLQLEILDSSYALVEWFTYDDHGGQRWIQGVGQIAQGTSGDTIEFPQLYVTAGGHFGANFNPDEVHKQVVGNATLSFNDCNTGTFQYSVLGQSQTLPMQRLTQTMGAGCQPINGVPGEPVNAYAGQSGSWYDTSHSGEGFELQWLTDDRALVIWYTYDTQGNQTWLLGVGTQQPDGSIQFEHMDRPHGPHFGSAFEPADLRHEDWGTLTLQIDCSAGTAHYTSSDATFGTGTLNLTRLTSLKKPGCPTLKPKLTDLYDITWNEIPIEAGTPLDPNYLNAESIADDGTIAGRRNGHLVLWHPDTQTWEDIPRELAAVPVNISPDALSVIATDDSGAAPTDPSHILEWQRSTGWLPLSGDVLSVNVAQGVSHNFKYVVGYGHNVNEVDHVWVRPINGVQQVFPVTSDVPTGIPFAVSDNGNTAIGVTLRFPTNYPHRVAARWDVDGQPQILRNPTAEELAVASACDSECNTIFGAGLYDYDSKGNSVFDPNHPHPGEAWYLKNGVTFGYLGALSDAPVTSRSYAVSDATADGSLAVGTYTAYVDPDNPNLGTTLRAFVWTQATGIISSRTLQDELGIEDDTWDQILAVRISLDGRHILVGGVRDPNSLQFRAVVLQITPRQTTD